MTRINGFAGKKILAGGFTAALLGAAVLSAPLAAADDIPVGGDGGVDLTLTVEDTGELYMTVDTTVPVVLAEDTAAPDAVNRTFTGTLPTVTVTDTRSSVPEDVAWSVTGQSTDFVHEEDDTVSISNEYLGWVPALVDTPEDNGQVGVGAEVEPVTEGGAGFTSGIDLLVGAYNSEEAQGESEEWQADAELRLVAPAEDIVAGNYSATLTLSLFEY